MLWWVLGGGFRADSAGARGQTSTEGCVAALPVQHGQQAHCAWFMFATNCISLQEAGGAVLPGAWDLMSVVAADV
jgi:hypothetical protein